MMKGSRRVQMYLVVSRIHCVTVCFVFCFGSKARRSPMRRERCEIPANSGLIIQASDFEREVERFLPHSLTGPCNRLLSLS